MEFLQLINGVRKLIGEVELAHDEKRFADSQDSLAEVAGLIQREIGDDLVNAETPESEKSDRSEAPPSEADVVVNEKAFGDEKLRTVGHCLPDQSREEQAKHEETQQKTSQVPPESQD